MFGDVPRKLESQWSERGGASGYAQHVAEVVEQFGHVELDRDAWSVVSPASSMPAHLLLCAVRLLDLTKVAEVAAQIRHTFFVEAKDVSRRSELLTIVESTGLVVSEVEATWDSGHAHAELSSDLNLARDKFVASSPTLLFNEDRQRLTGNVGYRVIEANVREREHRAHARHVFAVADRSQRIARVEDDVVIHTARVRVLQRLDASFAHVAIDVGVRARATNACV